MRIYRWCVYLLFSLSIPAFAVDVEALGELIPRFRQVSASIYAGGNPTTDSRGQGLSALAANGLYTLMNLQGGDIDGSFYGWVNRFRQPGDFPEAIEAEKAEWEAMGLEWFNFSLTSHKPVSSAHDNHIREALNVLAMATPEKPLFIHCEHGADRTGLLIALHRVLHLGWSVRDAVDEWVRNGHGRVSRLFTGHLDTYFYQLIEELKPEAIEEWRSGCMRRVI